MSITQCYICSTTLTDKYSVLKVKTFWIEIEKTNVMQMTRHVYKANNAPTSYPSYPFLLHQLIHPFPLPWHPHPFFVASFRLPSLPPPWKYLFEQNKESDLLLNDIIYTTYPRWITYNFCLCFVINHVGCHCQCNQILSYCWSAIDGAITLFE